MDRAYRIRLAEPRDLAALQRIETEAATRFVHTPHTEAVTGDATSIAEFVRAQRAGRLWVAVTETDQPVAFAFVDVVADCAHLDELDVLPSHGRRGVGAALVDTVCTWARERGYPAVTLTTYRDVAWNAPFYAKLGFAPVPPEELHPEQREVVLEEAEMGLRSDRRFFMRLELDPR